jgi:hypothetical protein
MSKLRDVMELSEVSIKQIQDFHKKELINEVIAQKTTHRKKSLCAISKELGVSESTIRKYQKDLNCSTRRRQLTATQKQDAMLKMQLGKVRARYMRDELSEDELNKKVAEIEKKIESLRSEQRSTVTSSVTINSKSKRGGMCDSDDDNEAITITEEKAKQKQVAAPDYDVEKLMQDEIKSHLSHYIDKRKNENDVNQQAQDILASMHSSNRK